MLASQVLLDKCIQLKLAQVLIETWRQHNNTIRPHSSLGYQLPAPEASIDQSSQIELFSLTL
jgi:hypothetical protein